MTTRRRDRVTVWPWKTASRPMHSSHIAWPQTSVTDVGSKQIAQVACPETGADFGRFARASALAARRGRPKRVILLFRLAARCQERAVTASFSFTLRPFRRQKPVIRSARPPQQHQNGAQVHDPAAVERSRLAPALDSRDGRGRRAPPRHKETRRERHHKYPCSLNSLLFLLSSKSARSR